MQVHSLVRFDDVMPLLREYKQEKRIRYIGATTAAPRQHAEFLEIMRKHPLDFVQVDYSIASRDSAKDLLPLAQERGIAVINNMPFGGRNGSLFPRVAGKPLPDWAKEFDATTWAQFMLKYNLSHPAITVAIPVRRRLRICATTSPAGRAGCRMRRCAGAWSSIGTRSRASRRPASAVARAECARRGRPRIRPPRLPVSRSASGEPVWRDSSRCRMLARNNRRFRHR